jgi:hypothetical protein
MLRTKKLGSYTPGQPTVCRFGALCFDCSLFLTVQYFESFMTRSRTPMMPRTRAYGAFLHQLLELPCASYQIRALRQSVMRACRGGNFQSVAINHPRLFSSHLPRIVCVRDRRAAIWHFARMKTRQQRSGKSSARKQAGRERHRRQLWHQALPGRHGGWGQDGTHMQQTPYSLRMM